VNGVAMNLDPCPKVLGGGNLAHSR
jgi:hypothetical protein